MKKQKGIRPMLRRFLTSFIKTNLSFDIETRLRMRALDSTCEYIEKNMVDVTMYNCPEKLMDAMLQKVSVDGSYSEFGVFKGKTINHIAKIISPKTIHGFDSFDGLPEKWLSTHDKSHFAVKELPKFQDNVQVYKGWFSDTLPDFVKQNNEKIAFIHIDCDLYSSTKTVFEFLKDRFVKGSIIVFDEYFAYPFWEHHEYKAFQEFVAQNNLHYEYLSYSTNSFGAKVGVRIV